MPLPARAPTSVRTAAVALASKLALVLAAAGAVGTPARPLHAQPARDVSATSERPEVRDVRFVGVRSVPTAVLGAALMTQASQCVSLLYRPFCLFSKSPYIYQRQYLDHAELERDVVRVLVFYYKRGWRDAQVDTSVTRAGRNAVDVTFTVREGAPTRVRTIAVGDTIVRPGAAGVAPPASRVPARTLADRLIPRPGQPLNTLRLDTAVVAVRDAYYERGYGNAVVAKPRIADDTVARLADVVVPVAPGALTPISRIDIVHLGQRREVKDETIRAAITLKPGDLFKRSEVARSQRALYESGYFRSALIDTALAVDATTGQTVCISQASIGPRIAPPGTTVRSDSTKALAICVDEAPLREARTSFGFSTADFLQVEGRFTHNYFTGTSRRLDAQAVIGNLGSKALYHALPQAVFQNPFQIGNLPGNRDNTYFLPTYNVGLTLTQQYVGSPRNQLGAGVFASRRSSPGVYVDQSQGANFTFTRRILDAAALSFGYRFQLSRVQAGDVYFCVNFGICDGPTIAVLQSQRKLSPVSAVLSFSRTDDPFEPTRGTQGQVTLEHASAATLSDFKYNRGFAEIAYYRPAPGFPKVTLAARVRGGYVGVIGSSGTGNVLQPQTRFYAGGAQSVRGFGENQLGPRTLTIAPGDLRGDSTFKVGDVTRTAYRCTAAAQPGADPNSPGVLRQCFQERRYVVGDGSFTPRALGGSALVEGSVEARMPLPGPLPLIGAIFVDAGALGESSLRSLTSGTNAITPGFGIRYKSPVGPVRVDLGIRPGKFSPTLPVVTQYVDSSSGRPVNRLLDLSSGATCTTDVGALGCRRYPADSLSGFRKITGRLVLHLSIGEAF